MDRTWSDDPREGLVREVARGGEWRDGVYIPARTEGSRRERNTLIHDLVRTLLDLRGS
jgi:hypothetical protein